MSDLILKENEENQVVNGGKEKKPIDKKDMVKNVAIAFLSVMLILTFFSNTIMNYTLPQVATQQIMSGPISPQIRGTGTISAEDPYNISLKETRKISGVAVKEGAHVEIGDVIYYLEDRESDELKDAREALATLELSYEQSLFSGDVPDNVITNVRNGKQTTYDTYQAELKAVMDRYQTALDNDNAVAAEIDYMKEQQAKDVAGITYDAMTPEYRLALPSIQAEEAAELNKDKSQLTTYAGQIGLSYSEKLAVLNQQKSRTAAELETATKVRDDLKKSINTEISLCQQRDKIAETKEKITKLEADSVGASVKSPVAGIVSSIAKASGETASPDEAIAVIQVDGKDMTMSFSVTNAQAQKLRVGDQARPQNVWQFGDDFKATLTSIKNDKADPANKKLLTFKIVSKDVTPGQTVSLSIGERSVEYDLVVPNSAIKTGNAGKYILVVKSKSSPLGNRYMASKVDVTVTAQDDNYTAISAAVDGDEYVITTANDMINPGDQVRLANE
ncbi:MAG: hypothetical protein K6G10_00330 [Butyrivibrio sp.]|nr:hypothetical protein [Butyrivibrio sp.]